MIDLRQYGEILLRRLLNLEYSKDFNALKQPFSVV